MKKVMRVCAVALVVMFPLTMLSGCAKKCCDPAPCEPACTKLEKMKQEYGCK